MEQRPAGKHKSKMAGTVTPGTTIMSLSFRLRKFALLWEFPKLTFFFQLHYLNLAEERAKLDALGEEGQTGCMVM